MNCTRENEWELDINESGELHCRRGGGVTGGFGMEVAVR